MDERPLDALYSDADAGVATADDLATDESEDLALEEQRAEVEQTRAAVSETIEAIREKLSPHHLVEQAKETVREATVGKAQEAVSNVVDTAKEAVGSAMGTAREAVSNVGDAMSNVGETMRDTGSSVMDTIRQNPVPAALIAVGLGWLYWSSRQRADQDRARWRQRDGYDPYAPASRYGASYPSAGTAARPGSTTAGEQGGAGERVDQARQKAGEIVDRTQEAVGDFVDRAQAVAGRVVDRTQEAAGNAAGAARDAAGNVAEAARSAGSTVWESIQANPIPAAMAAFSLAWFFTSARRHGDDGGDYERWAQRDRERWERGGDGGSAQWNRALSAGGVQAEVDDPYDRTGFRSDRPQTASSSSYSEPGSSRSRSFGDAVQRTVQNTGSQFQEWIRQSPGTAGAAALTLGAVAGLLIPETRRENELLGDARDNLVEKAQQTAQDLGEGAQAVAQQVIEKTGAAVSGGNGGQGSPGGQGGGPSTGSAQSLGNTQSTGSAQRSAGSQGSSAPQPSEGAQGSSSGEVPPPASPRSPASAPDARKSSGSAAARASLPREALAAYEQPRRESNGSAGGQQESGRAAS